MSDIDPCPTIELDQASVLRRITVRTLSPECVEAKVLKTTGISAPDFADAIGGRRVSVSIIIEMSRLLAMAQDDICDKHKSAVIVECAMSTVRFYKYGKLYRATRLLHLLHQSQ